MIVYDYIFTGVPDTRAWPGLQLICLNSVLYTHNIRYVCVCVYVAYFIHVCVRAFSCDKAAPLCRILTGRKCVCVFVCECLYSWYLCLDCEHAYFVTVWEGRVPNQIQYRTFEGHMHVIRGEHMLSNCDGPLLRLRLGFSISFNIVRVCVEGCLKNSLYVIVIESAPVVRTLLQSSAVLEHLRAIQ